MVLGDGRDSVAGMGLGVMGSSVLVCNPQGMKGPRTVGNKQESVLPVGT